MSPAFSPAYFDTYFDPDDENYMFTKLQDERFPLPHLKARSWYLDCVGGFLPSMENDLHRSLAGTSVGIVDDKFELLPIVEVEKERIEKAKKGKKGKGKAAPAKAPSTTNVATRSTTKVAAEASAAVDVTGVGSHFVRPLPVVEPPSQSEAPLSQLPPEVRKRKAVALDASVTSSGLIFVSSLIENPDKESLILAYMETNAYHTIYTRIQDFLGHVNFPCPLNSFISK